MVWLQLLTLGGGLLFTRLLSKDVVQQPILETIPPIESIPELPPSVPPDIPPQTPSCGALQIGQVLASSSFRSRGVQSRTVSYPVKNIADFIVNGLVQITSFDALNKTVVNMKSQAFSFSPRESKFLTFSTIKYDGSKREMLGWSNQEVPYDYQIDFVLNDGTIMAQVLESFS